MNHQEIVDSILSYPTLTRGVYYSDHRALVLQYLLWYALTDQQWGGTGDEPARCREYRHYLEAVGFLT